MGAGESEPAQTSPSPRPPTAAGGDSLSALLETGEHALLDLGELNTARAAFDEAARAAVRHQDTDGLARAALGLGGIWVHEHRTVVEGRRVRAWQRHALEALDPTSELALRLRVRCAAEADYSEGGSERILAALSRVRDQGTPLVMAEALSLAHHCLLGPAHAEIRLALADELLEVAAMTGRPVDESVGLLWRAVDQLLAGDPHAGRAVEELRSVTARTGIRAVQFVLSAIEVMLLARADDLDLAEVRAVACRDLGHQVGDADADGWFAAQLINIRWSQGRVGEVAPMLDAIVNSPTLAAPNESLLAGLAMASADAGDLRAASEALRRVQEGGLGSISASSTWLVTMGAVIEAAATIGDHELADEAYGLLLPYANRPMMASLAVVCFGSAHYSLGRAAALNGRVDVAIEHFSSAVRANQALGHRPAVERSRRALGELGVRAKPVRARATCRRSADGWRVSLEQRSVVVADSVGMRYLATLLGNPGQEILALQLAGGQPAGAAMQDVLDGEARRAYVARLAQLREDRDDAERRDDTEQVEALESELRWLLDEVGSATGLRGRDRHFTDEQERARTSVQKALRRAVAQISAAQAQLGAAIDAELVTGARCCYLPQR